MTRSESKKKRDKMPLDPAQRRGDFGEMDVSVRTTPTMKKRQERKEKKHKNRQEWKQY